MRCTRLTEQESLELVNYQISACGINIVQGQHSIEDLGDILPGAVMVQDLAHPKLTYMNAWGCQTLYHSLDELLQMGDEYYKKFFVESECDVFLAGMISYVQRQDPTSFYSFCQTVKTGRSLEAAPYHTTCKLLSDKDGSRPSNQLILISTPVSGLGQTIKKLSKFLDENEYAVRNHQRFLLLTRREKDIITLLAEGKSSAEISEILFISSHTVSTHRKNIGRKLQTNSFAELFKFANAFDLIRY